jgi:hypothetical protein
MYFLFFSHSLDSTNVSRIRETLVLSLRRDLCVVQPSSNSIYFLFFSHNLDSTNVSQIRETLVLSLRRDLCVAKPSNNSVFCYFWTKFGLKECLSDPRDVGMVLDCVAKPSNNSFFFCYFLTNFGLKECLSDPRDIDVALEAWPLWSSTFREVHLNIIFWRYLGWTNVSRIRET